LISSIHHFVLSIPPLLSPLHLSFLKTIISFPQPLMAFPQLLLSFRQPLLSFIQPLF
jgi:hypothetical protein